jgi:hypothetical protein
MNIWNPDKATYGCSAPEDTIEEAEFLPGFKRKASADSNDAGDAYAADDDDMADAGASVSAAAAEGEPGSARSGKDKTVAASSISSVPAVQTATPSGAATPATAAPAKKRKRSQATKGLQWVQCERCKKWRTLTAAMSASELPEVWFCEMNTWFVRLSTCDAAEETAEDHEALRLADADAAAGTATGVQATFSSSSASSAPASVAIKAEGDGALDAGENRPTKKARLETDGAMMDEDAPAAASTNGAVSMSVRIAPFSSGSNGILPSVSTPGPSAGSASASPSAALPSPTAAATPAKPVEPNALCDFPPALPGLEFAANHSQEQQRLVKAYFQGHKRTDLTAPLYVGSHNEYHNLLLIHPPEVWADPASGSRVMEDAVRQAWQHALNSGAQVTYPDRKEKQIIKVPYREVIPAYWGTARPARSASGTGKGDLPMSARESHMRWSRSSSYNAKAAGIQMAAPATGAANATSYGMVPAAADALAAPPPFRGLALTALLAESAPITARYMLGVGATGDATATGPRDSTRRVRTPLPSADSAVEAALAAFYAKATVPLTAPTGASTGPRSALTLVSAPNTAFGEMRGLSVAPLDIITEALAECSRWSTTGGAFGQVFASTALQRQVLEDSAAMAEILLPLERRQEALEREIADTEVAIERRAAEKAKAREDAKAARATARAARVAAAAASAADDGENKAAAEEDEEEDEEDEEWEELEDTLRELQSDLQALVAEIWSRRGNQTVPLPPVVGSGKLFEAMWRPAFEAFAAFATQERALAVSILLGLLLSGTGSTAATLSRWLQESVLHAATGDGHAQLSPTAAMTAGTPTASGTASAPAGAAAGAEAGIPSAASAAPLNKGRNAFFAANPGVASAFTGPWIGPTESLHAGVQLNPTLGLGAEAVRVRLDALAAAGLLSVEPGTGAVGSEPVYSLSSKALEALAEHLRQDRARTDDARSDARPALPRLLLALDRLAKDGARAAGKAAGKAAGTTSQPQPLGFLLPLKMSKPWQARVHLN